MKKRILAFFLLLVICVPMLTACGTTIKNAGRYALYVSNGQLFRLDASDGESKSVGLQGVVESVYDARVGDSGKKMIFGADTSTGDSQLYYWDGKSDQATYIDGDAQLVKVSQDMETCIYEKSGELYRYTTQSGSTLLTSQLRGLAMSDDGASVFYSELIVEQLSADFGRTTGERLYRVEKDGSPVPIADAALSSINIASDYSAAAYLRYDETPKSMPDLESWPAYLWTEKAGEKRLPFRATNLRVMSENEIYYSVKQDDGYYEHYYYDGESSYLVGMNANDHGHKVGKYYVFQAKEPEWGQACNFMVYRKWTAQIDGYTCPQRGGEYISVCSIDKQTVYTWKRDYEDGKRYLISSTYRNGAFEVTAGPEVEPYSSKYAKFRGEVYQYMQDGDLYQNGAMVAESVDKGYLSADGQTTLYRKEDKLWLHREGATDKVIFSGIEKNALPMANHAALVRDENDTLYFATENKETTLAGGVTDMTEVLAWSEPQHGNITFGGADKGMFYAASLDLVYGPRE